MIVTYNKAEIVEDENGKFLHLELQFITQGSKVIIKNIFASTENHAPAELQGLSTDAGVMLSNTAQE